MSHIFPSGTKRIDTYSAEEEKEVEEVEEKVEITDNEKDVADDNKESIVEDFAFNAIKDLPDIKDKANELLDDIKEKVEELIKLVNLDHRVDHLPRQLSGGERQRVAIARSLSTEPAILLADEPTGNLDSKTGFAIMELISNLHKQGKTIILVTHEAEVAKYANRTITLIDGKVKGDKTWKK